MERTPVSSRSHIRHAASVIALCLGICAQFAIAGEVRPDQGRADGDPPQIPDELRGFWDMAPYPCHVGPGIESDSRIEIAAGFVRGYEELMEVQEVQQLSSSPPAWRILATSDVAPPELQGAAIYVLASDSLTIADEGQSRIYVRCRVDSSRAGDS